MPFPEQAANICARRPIDMASHAIERRRVAFSRFSRLRVTNFRSILRDEVAPSCAWTTKGAVSALRRIRISSGMSNLPAPLWVQRYPVVIFIAPDEIEGQGLGSTRPRRAVYDGDGDVCIAFI